MSYKVEITDNFKKEAKRLIKKYPSLRAEIAALGEQLAENPSIGTPIGDDVYKIRISIASNKRANLAGQGLFLL